MNKNLYENEGAYASGLAKQYAEKHAPKIEKSKYPLEYAIRNTFISGWNERKEEVDFHKKNTEVLTDILLKTTTPEFLADLKKTYFQEASYGRAIDELNRLLNPLLKKKESKRRKTGKAVKTRNAMLEMLKAENAHKLLNGKD